MSSRILVQISSLALLGLLVAGCNETSQPASTTQTAQLPCRCALAQATPVANAPAPLRPHRRWHVAHAWRTERADAAWHETSMWRESDEASSTVEYGSRAEVASGYGARGYAGSESEAHFAAWTDGYGRSHFGGRFGGHDRDWQRVDDDRSRQDPWHGYDDRDGLENGY